MMRRLTTRARVTSFKCSIVGALVLTLVLAATAGSDASDEQLWRPTALSDSAELPDAREVVSRLCEFMATNTQLGFEALVSYEALQESGQQLQFDMLQRIKIVRPGRLFWVTLHDNAAVDSAWFDTGAFTLLRQPANVWGRVELPADIPAAVDRLVHEYNLDVPFADILAGDPQELWLGEDVTSVEYVAEAWVEGAWTDHVAIRKAGRDIEIWILKGNKPFPMRLRVVFTDAESQPSYVARFRQWTTAVQASEMSVFKPPPGSERVEVVPVSQ